MASSKIIIKSYHKLYNEDNILLGNTEQLYIENFPYCVYGLFILVKLHIIPQFTHKFLCKDYFQFCLCTYFVPAFFSVVRLITLLIF